MLNMSNDGFTERFHHCDKKEVGVMGATLMNGGIPLVVTIPTPCGAEKSCEEALSTVRFPCFFLTKS